MNLPKIIGDWYHTPPPFSRGEFCWTIPLTSVVDPDPVLCLPLDLGSGMGKKSRSGYEIWDEHPGFYFQELRNNFLCKKYFQFFDVFQIWDPGSFRPWIRDGKFGSGIWNKHPGSATLSWTALCNLHKAFLIENNKMFWPANEQKFREIRFSFKQPEKIWPTSHNVRYTARVF